MYANAYLENNNANYILHLPLVAHIYWDIKKVFIALLLKKVVFQKLSK